MEIVTFILKIFMCLLCIHFMHVHACMNLFKMMYFFMLLPCSNHGQPSFDKPSVADSRWDVSLQHPAGWELHPTLTWRLQLHWLASYTLHSPLCVCAPLSDCVHVYTCHPYVCFSLTVCTQIYYCVWVLAHVCVCVSVCLCLGFVFLDYVAVRQTH